MIEGVGVDIVEIARVERALMRTPRLRLQAFTEQERAYCEGKTQFAQSFAVCFAAKEAVFKALQINDNYPHWQEIELLHEPSGFPYIHLIGRTEAIAVEKKITIWHISCSHSDTQAIAFVVAERG